VCEDFVIAIHNFSGGCSINTDYVKVPIFSPISLPYIPILPYRQLQLTFKNVIHCQKLSWEKSRDLKECSGESQISLGKSCANPISEYLNGLKHIVFFVKLCHWLMPYFD